METFQIKRILIPTDFSKTGMLAVDQAALMARLFKAELYLLHVVELSKNSYSMYSPAVQITNVKQIDKIVDGLLSDLLTKLRKEHAISVKTIRGSGRTSEEIVKAVKKNKIDIVVMGTHGVNGFNEIFVGSNAYKTVSICPCPVITVQTHTKKAGFTNIILPVDDSLYSRQKTDYAITLAKKYGARIHVLGLLERKGNTDAKKFEIKLDAIRKVVEKAGLSLDCKTVKGDNLAEEAIKYSKKVKADLIMVLSGRESNYDGKFLGAFSKQLVNHTKIPVMSIKPMEGVYDTISLSAASPF